MSSIVEPECKEPSCPDQDMAKTYNVENRFPLLHLPAEIILLILQHYFLTPLSCQYSIFDDSGRNTTTVETDVVDSNLLGRQYQNHVKLSQCLQRISKSLDILYTSKAISAAGRDVLMKISEGSLTLRHKSVWFWPRRKADFVQYMAPKLPLHLIRRLTLCSYDASRYGRALGCKKNMPRRCVTWEELTEFFDSDMWPLLETVAFHIYTLRPLRLRIEQIGGLLRGEYDTKLLLNWAPQLPKMNSWESKEIRLRRDNATPYDTNTDRDIMIEVRVIDSVDQWVRAWPRSYSRYGFSMFEFVLKGKNLMELQVVSRRMFYKLRYIKSAEMCEMDGTDWERKAAERWPNLRAILSARETTRDGQGSSAHSTEENDIQDTVFLTEWEINELFRTPEET